MTSPCDLLPQQYATNASPDGLNCINRRRFLKRGVTAAATLTVADFLGYFLDHGCPYESRRMAMAEDADARNDDPHFLIYWFVEGGWQGYSMFNPVMTSNDIHKRLDSPSDERYRVLNFGKEQHGIDDQGNIHFGYLAAGGKSLFPDLAVLSSMHVATFHSGQRLIAHMGDPDIKPQDDREDDERSVMQAFAEVYGGRYLLPHLSWHWWLSDGELNEAQYTGRKGYYHALGPVHAHTIYAGTPGTLKKFLRHTQASADDVTNRKIQAFLDGPNSEFTKESQLAVVKSYNSAVQIYKNLANTGYQMNRSLLGRLFTNSDLRAEFKIEPADEQLSYRSVNGHKARTKFSPNVNVQAMMAYELMCAGLSCAFWIETRDIRMFDSHFTRGALWNGDGSPRGQPDQTGIMGTHLWTPLITLVEKLKNTQYRESGKSLYDLTNIVLTSEFGRSIHGNVDEILKSDLPEDQKKEKINSQDISAHWKVTSAAFLGGAVQGNLQYGKIGEKTLMAIPILPDGSLDPAYDPISGEVRSGFDKSPKSFVPGHGDVYATALDLSDINPNGIGRNKRPPLAFIKNT